MLGAYTRGKYKVSNFNFSCNVKLLQIIITAQQLMVSPDQSNIRFFSLKPLHCKEIFLSENFLLKMASVKPATVTSSIKSFHVYRRSTNISQTLKDYWKKQNDTVTQQSRLLGTPMKQLDIYLMHYLSWLHQQ